MKDVIKKVLVCKNCESDVSGFVLLMDNKAFDVDRRSPAETYCVEQGVALKVNVGPAPSGDLFAIWMNGDDLLETITFDPKFYIGGGYYDGPNTICEC